jgi:allantoin racemase
MKILYLMPAAASHGPLGTGELRHRQAILQEHAAPGVEIIVRDIHAGPRSIESIYEEYLAIPEAIREIRRAERDNLSAAIMGCFGDPGVDGAREIAGIPIIGPCESSMHLAAMLGYSFSVVTVLESVKPIIRKVLQHTGLASRMASIRVTGTPVLELAGTRRESLRRVIDCGRQAVEIDGADTLILGCMSMAFLGISEEVADRLGVPVINPALASLKVAEMQASMRWTHSKRAYPTPRKEFMATAEV